MVGEAASVETPIVIDEETVASPLTSTDTLSINGWRIHASSNRISKDKKIIRLEPRAMGVLVYLVSRPGEVVRREQLEREVWREVVVGYDALSNTIKKLRRAFGDDPKHPQVIETIPKVGYRLIAEVGHSSSDTLSPDTPKPQFSKNWRIATVAALVLLVSLVVTVAWFNLWEASIPDKAASLENKPSIGVLPFTNMSGEPEQEYFADGLADDLITDLSRVSGLYVIARNSTFTYKGKSVDVRQLGKALGVRYILEGSVRRDEDQVRINVQLTDAKNGGHVWADRYDGSMNNIFVLQDEITRQVIAALAVRLTESEAEQVIGNETASPEAYDAFLEGWGHYLGESPEHLSQAVVYLQKSLELDPEFARGHAVLALVYERAIDRGWRRDLGLELAEAQELMNRHLQASMKQPTSITHHVKSRILLKERQHDLAILEMESAIDLEPNNFMININMAKALVFAGRPQEAIPYARKAMMLDPLNQAQGLWTLGFANFGMGRYEEAVSYLQRAIQSRPNLSRWALIAALAQANRQPEAVSALEAYQKLRGWGAPLNVSTMLKFHPYKHKADEERFAMALVKAGVPGYYTLLENDRLEGKAIRNLIFGQTITGIRIASGKQYWISYTEDGKATYRGGKQGLDTGTARVVGNQLCIRWNEIRKGQERCAFIYRNPDGSREGMDEYISEVPLRVYAWSLTD